MASANLPETDMFADFRVWLEQERARQAKWSPEYRATIQAAIDADYAAQEEHDLTHCSECGQEWCGCDEARDNALFPVTVPSLAGCRMGRHL